MLTRETRTRGTGRRRVRRGRRVARADRQQARACRRSWRWRACGTSSRARRLGTERDARQPRGGHARAVRAGPRTRAEAGAGAHRQDAADRHADPAGPRQVFLGRAPGRAHAAAGGGGDRALGHHAGLHQRALAGGDLVPAAAGGAAGLGRATSRCTTARWTGPRASGSSRASRKARCAPWSRPPRWTWASTSCRSSACCRWARPRAWRA
jgi:hypothetical protein